MFVKNNVCESKLIFRWYYVKRYISTGSYFLHYQARAKYLHVAKQMKAYEDQLYEQWKEGVEQILPGLLRKNLLVKPQMMALKEGSQVMDDENKEPEAGKDDVVILCGYTVWLYGKWL